MSNLYHITLSDNQLSQSLELEFKDKITIKEIKDFFNQITYLQVIQIKKVVYDHEALNTIGISQENKITSTYKQLRLLASFSDNMTMPLIFRNFKKNSNKDHIKTALASFIQLKGKRPVPTNKSFINSILAKS